MSHPRNSITLGLVFFISIMHIQALPIFAAKLKPCEYGGAVNGREAQTFQGYCPTDSDEDSSDSSSWYEAPGKEEKKKKEYRVKHTNRCGRSVEIIENCSVNPDQDRCDDRTFPYIETIYRVGGPRDGELLVQRLRCPEDPEIQVPGDLVEVEVHISPEQFRNFPIQASELNSNPEQFSLRHGHTHLWAKANNQTFNATINGTAVEIKAIPVQWLWNYGDGTKRTLDFPGVPDPAHTLHHETPTSHSYSETGTFEVNLTTLYRGEFRIVGEGWQPIPGQAAVPSNAMPIDVWRTEKELVAADGQ